MIPGLDVGEINWRRILQSFNVGGSQDFLHLFISLALDACFWLDHLLAFDICSPLDLAFAFDILFS